MRRLKTTDAFAAMRIIKEAGVRDEIRVVAAAAKKGMKIPRELGIDLFMGVFEGLAKVNAEKLIYDFLAGIWEMDAQEIMDQEIPKTLEMAKQYFEIEDKERWRAFFESVAELLNKIQ